MNRLARSILVATLAFPLSGCGTALWENPLPEAAYFDNTTNQTLYLRLRDKLDLKKEYWKIPANRTTPLQLLGKGECKAYWVITDEDAKIVKDPGQICWHQTVTIP